MYNDPETLPRGARHLRAVQPIDVPEWEWARHPLLRRVVVEPDGGIAWQLGPCAPHVMDECVSAVSHFAFRRSSAGTLVARIETPVNQDWFVEAEDDVAGAAHAIARLHDIRRWYVRHDTESGAETGFVCAETIDGVRRYFEWISGVWVGVPVTRWVAVRDGGVLEALSDDEARESFAYECAAPRIVRVGDDGMPREHGLLQVQLARAIAHSAHAAQVDKLGDPYIDHPARVAAGFDPEEQPVEHAAAWLHDVLEDTGTTAADLLQAGIDPEIVEVVALLTKDAALPRDEYYERIRGNAKALAVKAADLDDNTAPWRTARLDAETRERLARKYAHARVALGLEREASAPRGPVLYIDMDNTLVDFRSAFPLVDPRMLEAYRNDADDIPGIFAQMKPMKGAIEAVKTLAERYDVYVLSTAPWRNPSAWSDKLSWIQRHFGSDEGTVLYKRLILSHHKDLNRGAILIDDRPGHNGAGDFDGTVVHFGSAEYRDWASVVEALMEWDPETQGAPSVEKVTA